MAERLGRALLELDTDDRRYNKGIREARQGAQRMDRDFRNHTDSMKRSFRTLGTVVAAVVTGVMIRRFVQLTDTYQQLEGQLRVVESSQAAANERFEDLRQLANDTRANLEGTVTVYTRLARANREFGATQAELLQFTETLNQAIAASGASAQEASAAMVQFAQGMASGELRGEELRSVMEQLPRLAIAIADGLQINGVGALREMAEQGELTAERVFGAVMSQTQAIEREFNQLPRRVDQALTQLGNDMLKAFGQADVSGLVDAIDEFREIVTDPAFVNAVTSLAEATFNFLGGTAQLISDVSEQWREYQEGVARTEARRAVIQQAEQVQALTDRLKRLRQELGRDFPGDKPISIIGGRTLDDLRRERDVQLEILNAMERQRRSVETSASLGIREAGGFAPITTESEQRVKTTLTTLERIDAKVKEMRQAGDSLAGPAGGLLTNPLEAYAPLAEEAEEQTEELTDRQRELANAAEETGFAFRSAFADAIVEGENLRSVLQGLLKDLAQIVFRETAGRALSNAVTNLVAGATGAENRAAGGPVTAGRPFIVGEQGPELFVPRNSGDIVPNGGSGVRIEHVDMRGASMEAVARLEQLINQVNGSIETRAIGAVSEDYARGGTTRGVIG